MMRLRRCVKPRWWSAEVGRGNVVFSLVLLWWTLRFPKLLLLLGMHLLLRWCIGVVASHLLLLQQLLLLHQNLAFIVETRWCTLLLLSPRLWNSRRHLLFSPQILTRWKISHKLLLEQTGWLLR